MNTPDESQTIVDEMCYCGHLKSEHLDSCLQGHGPCNAGICECKQFTWKDFIFDTEGPRDIDRSLTTE